MITLYTNSYGLLAVALVNLSIALYVLWKSPRDQARRAFFLFVCGIAVWVSGFVLISTTQLFVFDKMIIYGGLVMFVGLFLFSQKFPRPLSLAVSPWLLYAPAAFAALVIIPSNLINTGMHILPNGHIQPIAGPLQIPYNLLLLCYAAASAWCFWRQYRESAAGMKAQLRYLFAASGILLCCAFVSDGVLPSFGIVSFNLIGPLSSILLVGRVGYAIVRHELMDIRIIIRRGLLYGLMLALVGGTYLTLVGALGFFFGTNTYTLLASAALTALGVALAAPLITQARLYQEAQRHTQELEERVQERTKELSVAQERQRHMMLEIAHGLQTPLTVFQTKLEKLKTLKQREVDVEAFEQSIADLSNFVHNLLTLAQLEHAGRQVEHSPISLSELVAEAAEEIGIIAAAEQISVHVDIESGLTIRGNAEELRSAVMNLASNAIKYMRPQGQREITITLDKESGKSCLRVKDTGLGIAPQDLPHVFERFYRAESAAGRISGNGLGLAITRQLVERHGGSIAVESELGRGTTMTIRLPKAVL